MATDVTGLEMGEK